MGNSGSHHQRLLKENVRKTKKTRNDLQLEIKDLGVVYARGGVNTLGVRHEKDSFYSIALKIK